MRKRRVSSRFVASCGLERSSLCASPAPRETGGEGDCVGENVFRALAAHIRYFLKISGLVGGCAGREEFERWLARDFLAVRRLRDDVQARKHSVMLDH
jgi:hypothetical protein